MSVETYEEFTDWCRAIAALHAKAREVRRKARFLAWLRENGCCRPGLLHCEAATSPEEALVAAATNPDPTIGSGPCWVTSRMDDAWWSRLDCAETEDFCDELDVEPENREYRHTLSATEALVASPEWLSLPWQAEPAFVPMSASRKKATIDRAMALGGR